MFDIDLLLLGSIKVLFLKHSYKNSFIYKAVGWLVWTKHTQDPLTFMLQDIKYRRRLLAALPDSL